MAGSGLKPAAGSRCDVWGHFPATFKSPFLQIQSLHLYAQQRDWTHVAGTTPSSSKYLTSGARHPDVSSLARAGSYSQLQTTPGQGSKITETGVNQARTLPAPGPVRVGGSGS